MTSKISLLGAALVSLLVAAACNTTTTDVPAECEAFLDTTEEATPMTIAIENDSPDPIYLVSNGCGSEVELILRDSDGNFVPRGIGGCGAQSCEVLMEEPRYDCAAACALPPTIMIEPGGRFETSWHGYVMTQTEMPAGCFADATTQSSGACPQKLVAEAGVYVAGFNVATDISCENGSCSCTPNADGFCTIDWAQAQQMDEVTGEVQYPGETQIELAVGDGLGS